MTQHCYNCGKPFPAFITNGYVICGACGASNGDAPVPFGNYIVECSIDIPMQNIGVNGVVKEKGTVKYTHYTIESDLGRLSDDPFFIKLVHSISKGEQLTDKQRHVLLLCIEAYERSLKLSCKGFSFDGREDLKEDFEFIIEQVEEITRDEK